MTHFKPGLGGEILAVARTDWAIHPAADPLWKACNVRVKFFIDGGADTL